MNDTLEFQEKLQEFSDMILALKNRLDAEIEDMEKSIALHEAEMLAKYGEDYDR